MEDTESSASPAPEVDKPFFSTDELFDFAHTVFELRRLGPTVELDNTRMADQDPYQILLRRFIATLRARLALGICGVVRQHKLTDTEAAALLYLAWQSLKKEEPATAAKVALVLKKFRLGALVSNYHLVSDPSRNLCAKSIVIPTRDILVLNPDVRNLILEKPFPKSKPKPEMPNVEIKQSPKDLCQKLDQYVIAQETAKRVLSTAIFEHLTKINLHKKTGKKYTKNNVFLIGPTGTGKTYLCEILGKTLNIPVFFFDASQYTESGYVGQDVCSIVESIRARTSAKNNILPPCIAFIDEIDKISEKVCIGHNTNRDVSGKSVQEELLRMLEADTIMAEKRELSGRESHEINIQNVLFIVAGAFNGLQDIISKRINNGKGIGFNREMQAVEVSAGYTDVTQDDLVAYGFMPEFVGRFAHLTATNPLSKQDLVQILTKAKNNIVEQSTEVLQHCGIAFEAKAEIIEQLADKAITKGTGARGLAQAFSVTVSGLLYENAKIPKFKPDVRENSSDLESTAA